MSNSLGCKVILIVNLKTNSMHVYGHNKSWSNVMEYQHLVSHLLLPLLTLPFQILSSLPGCSRLTNISQHGFQLVGNKDDTHWIKIHNKINIKKTITSYIAYTVIAVTWTKPSSIGGEAQTGIVLQFREVTLHEKGANPPPGEGLRRKLERYPDGRKWKRSQLWNEKYEKCVECGWKWTIPEEGENEKGVWKWSVVHV